MPIPRRNPRDSLTQSPSDWTQLRSVDTEKTPEARRSLVSPPDSFQVLFTSHVSQPPIMADSPMYTRGRKMGQPPPQRAAGKRPPSNAHGCALSMRARSTSRYLFALASIFTIWTNIAICAQPDHQTRTVVELSEKQLHSVFPELAGLKSADRQADLPAILQHVAASEDAFLRNIPDLTAREDIVVQQQSHAGGMDRTFPVFSGKYTYLVLAHRESDGGHLVEYRTDRKGKEIKPGLEFAPASTQGFALLALFFDSFHQTLASFRYLGRQQLDRREMYVVAFAQQPNAARLIGQIYIGGKLTSTAYQGIAWIDPIKFQIHQMRTDLLEPRPDVGLLAQTTEIHFMEVRLPAVATPLWLPRSVVVSSQLNGQLIRNRHTYRNYQRYAAKSRIVPVP
jgi:hypothetical protein